MTDIPQRAEIQKPTRASFRLFLVKVLPSDTDLRSLCIDYMPHLLGLFGAGMSFDAMLNAVLERVEPSELLGLLQTTQFADRVAKYKHLLVPQTPPDEPRPLPPDSGRRSLPPPRSAYDSTFYVARRDEETQAFDALEFPGAAVVLMGAERFGKTWLLSQILSQMEERGRVVNLDLRAFGHADIMASYSRFLRELARQMLVNACGMSAEKAAALLDEAWRYSDNPIDNLNSTMKKEVLSQFRDGRMLIIALDGVDALSGFPYLEDFFTLLRTWMDNAGRPQWSALRLLLSLAMPPRLLIQNVHQSPFNIATYVYLSDLDDAQVGQLAALHGLTWDGTDRQALMALVGGHPYLLRLAMYAAKRHGYSVSELVSASGKARVFADYLEHCERFLHANPALHDSMRRILSDPKAPLDFECLDRLRHAGFLVQDDATGAYRLRYALFQRLRLGR